MKWEQTSDGIFDCAQDSGFNPARYDLQPTSYQAQFRNGGTDLVLIDEKSQFLVLSLCD